MEKFGRVRQVTDENTCIAHRMHIACWITIATDINSECIIFIAFPMQQWLRECATMLRCTYIVGLVFSTCHVRTAHIHCST